MPKQQRLGDEEHGKRDDDHRLRIKPNRDQAWYGAGGSLRRARLMRKRIGLGFLFAIAMYLFIHFMPEGVQRPSNRPQYHGQHTEVVGGEALHPHPPKNAPTQAEEEVFEISVREYEKKAHWYDGPIYFHDLKESLVAISVTGGTRLMTRNVMFAASSLESASTLLPMACEMGRLKRNVVHFSFMGRDNISMDMLREINGVDKSCGVMMHDARPDYPVQSTSERMEHSVGAALGHITNYMHPQAIIIDGSENENEFFLDGTKYASERFERTLIKLPPRADQSLRWITRLDSGALNSFSKIRIDILVHAKPQGSGSMLRLLHSLSRADYFDSTPPLLTIELAHDVDPDVERQLSHIFTWPPHTAAVESRLTLHRRIKSAGISPDESSVRFLEAFWPKNADSHVLVLSPEVELSPLFYHYLKFTILEYKYSFAAQATKNRNDLMGISLTLPSTYLNDSTPFTPPTQQPAGKEDTNVPTFLWQAPSADATLYFGDKWKSLNSLVSHLSSSTPHQEKRVSKTHAAWLEQILTLSLIRGYSTLYPQLISGESLATVHNELWTPPEEYSHLSLPESDGFKAGEDHSRHEAPVAHGNLLDVLPEGLPTTRAEMLLLTWDGRVVDRDGLLTEAAKDAEGFRREVGGCKTPWDEEMGYVFNADIDKLFCHGGDEETEPVAATESDGGEDAADEDKQMATPDQAQVGNSGTATDTDASAVVAAPVVVDAAAQM